MSSSFDYKTLEAWCQDAITILAATGVPEKIVDMQRSAVARNSGASALYEIADSLAEGLSFLPDEEREIARQELVTRHGFDFELFVDKKLKKVKSILRRGKIRNEAEFRELSEFASDTTHSGILLDAADTLLAKYEAP